MSFKMDDQRSAAIEESISKIGSPQRVLWIALKCMNELMHVWIAVALFGITIIRKLSFSRYRNPVTCYHMCHTRCVNET